MYEQVSRHINTNKDILGDKYDTYYHGTLRGNVWNEKMGGGIEWNMPKYKNY